MDNLVNLASLPKGVALLQARAAGRNIFADEDAVAAGYEYLSSRWFSKNMPYAVGQTDDEFSALVADVEKEFEAGVDDAVRQARSDAQPVATLERASVMLTDAASAAWQVFNVLAFMVEAVPYDPIGSLPIRCTLSDLREQMDKLATDLMCLVTNAEREAGGSDHV